MLSADELPDPGGPRSGHVRVLGKPAVDLQRHRAVPEGPQRPSAVRVLFESFVIVFLRRAPAWAFLTFLLAAARCFAVAI